jgi:hypothetical protein
VRWLLHHFHYFTPFVFLQFGFDFGDLTDALAGFFEDIIGLLIGLIQFIWSVLVFAFNYLFAGMNFLANFTGTLMEDISHAWEWIWQTVIMATLTKLIGLINRLRAWLKNVLQPIIDFLKKLRAWYDKLFNTYVKPFLNLLQHIRQFLRILRLLGVKWAARLDADLAYIEQKIVQVYTYLRSQLNMVITYLDLIVDPSGILRRNPLFAILLAAAPEVQNLLYGATQRPLLGSEVDSANQDAKRYTLASQQENFSAYYSKGELDPCKEASRQQFLKELDGIQNGSNASTN